MLDGAAYPQGRNRGPHAALAAQDPVVERLPRRRLEEADKVPGRDLGHQRHRGRRHLLVDEEAADARRQDLQGVELAQAVPHLEADHPQQEGRELGGPAAGLEQRRAVHVRLKKGDEIRSCLRDDEVVHVEELGYPTERRVSFVVRHVRPVMEISRVGRGPGHNVPVDVLAKDCCLASAVER